ncbi:MAG TPA: RNA polymerase sigma factor [Dehalococcoidia bacterium]|nr:RNA polymerase sigma factor [Dehalococcoidia bacterium]
MGKTETKTEPKLKSYDDETELVERLKQGDPDAVEQMYNANIDRVYSMVYNQVDKDREVAQEIVQETFIAAVKAIKYFQLRSSISTWLYSIASRKVADFYRHKKREDKYRVGYEVDSEKLPDSDQAEAGTGETEDSNIAIRQALLKLPLHYRQAVVLKYIEGFSVSDIGEIMGRTEKSVEGILARARKELQDELAIPGEG